MGHFSGKFEKDLKKILKKAKGREGKFYEIFNKHGFYDVSDENNGLTPEQRAQVPPENQNRFTQFSNAIAEMIGFVLGDDKGGMMTKSAQDTVDDMDAANQMSNVQLDMMGNSMTAALAGGVVPPGAGAGIKTAMESMKSMMGAILGKSYYSVNILPQFTFGLDGFGKLGDLGNFLKPGTLRPNWIFLYDHELVKNNKFFAGDDGKIKIGTNIDISEGNELYLKKIFNVVTADENLGLIGDLKGGLSQQEFNVVLNAREKGVVALDKEQGDKEIKEFKLNEFQIRAAFNQHVEMKLWKVISNRKNWAHGHWGALTHNSMPEFVKTAVCSFIWSNGLAIEEGKSEEAALISYLVHMGLFYLIGYQYPVKIYGIEEDEALGFEGDKGIINDQVQLFVGDSTGVGASSGGVVTFESPVTADQGLTTSVTGLPKNDKLAKRYFIWVADVLSRLTYNSVPEELAQKMRKRRIDEANLIYAGFGLPKIEYGAELSKISFEHTIDGLKQRKFHKLMDAVKGSFWRYSNEGSPGGTPTLQQQESTATLTYGSNAVRDDEGNSQAVPIEQTENYLKSLMDAAKISSLRISSTQRDKETQARIMFNNLNRNNIISYRQPGAAVTTVYFKKKEALGYTRSQPVINTSHQKNIRTAMENEIDRWGEGNVSRHCANVDEVRVFDLAPSSFKSSKGRIDPQAKTRFKNILEAEVLAGRIAKFLHPGNSKDNAFHIEIPQKGENTPVPFDTYANNALPSVFFHVANTNLQKGDVAWMAPLSNDYLSVSGKKEEED